MDERLKVSEACLPQLLRQRTGYKTVADPGTAWADSIRADFEQVAPYLPEECRASLDIGCGLAGFDILLWRARKAFVWLLDRDAFEENPRFGFGDNPSAYCLFSAIEHMMEINGVPRSDWFALRDLTGQPKQVDLVTSFIAWGFHFPVSVYLDAVSKILHPGGRLIIDLRAEHVNEADAAICEKVGPLIVSWPCGKYTRCVFERWTA